MRQFLDDGKCLRGRKASIGSKLFQLSLKHRSFKLIFNTLSNIIKTDRIYLSLEKFYMLIESRHILINLFDQFTFQSSVSLFFDFFSFGSINRNVLAFHQSGIISITELSIRFKNRTFRIEFSRLSINILNLRKSAHTSKSRSDKVSSRSGNGRIATRRRSSST